MPEIFNSMGATIDSRVIEDTLFHLRRLYHRDGRAVNEIHLYAYLRDRMPIMSIERTIEIMVKSQDIKRVYLQGMTCYVPKG